MDVASNTAELKTLTVEEVADLLHCSPRHVYRLEEKGLMPKAARPGSIVRWQYKKIAEWIESGCQPVLAV